jgi:iron complex transport system ATP-binding protein
MAMPSTSEALIAVDGLTVCRESAVILDHIAWSMRQGEHWVILGANGSGKTSLLMALTGYLMPTAGSISVLGRTFGETDWRDLRRHIGIVSSNLRQRIEEGESAREVVASGKYAMLNFWGTLTRADKADGQAWLDRVGCAHLARRPWAVLSQGERQRVLIARALIASPQLLILDEPCAGLDPVARERFLAFIESLTHSEATPGLILVTHHVEEITPSFTHALLLRDGMVIAQGPRRTTLTTVSLSRTFNHPLRLRHQAGRLHLTLPPTPAHPPANLLDLSPPTFPPQRKGIENNH